MNASVNCRMSIIGFKGQFDHYLYWDSVICDTIDTISGEVKGGKKERERGREGGFLILKKTELSFFNVCTIVVHNIVRTTSTIDIVWSYLREVNRKQQTRILCQMKNLDSTTHYMCAVIHSTAPTQIKSAETVQTTKIITREHIHKTSTHTYTRTNLFDFLLYDIAQLFAVTMNRTRQREISISTQIHNQMLLYELAVCMLARI